MELTLNDRQTHEAWRHTPSLEDQAVREEVYDMCVGVLEMAQELSGEYRMPMTNLIPLVATMLSNVQKTYDRDTDFERQKVLLELELNHK